MRIDFFIPAKNEAKILRDNIIKLADFLAPKLESYQWRIVNVINDSQDDSWEICCRLAADRQQRLLCLQASGPGKGRAIKEGWRASEADILVFMDADLAVDLEAVPSLLAPLLSDEADLVIGSRFLKTSIATRTWQRAFISQGYAYLSRLVLSHKQTDLQCGFKAIKRSSFMRIEKLLRDDYWFFDTELVLLVILAGGRVTEVPVSWRENRLGKNKSRVKVFRDSLNFFRHLLSFRHYLRSIKTTKI